MEQLQLGWYCTKALLSRTSTLFVMASSMAVILPNDMPLLNNIVNQLCAIEMWRCFAVLRA